VHWQQHVSPTPPPSRLSAVPYTLSTLACIRYFLMTAYVWLYLNARGNGRCCACGIFVFVIGRLESVKLVRASESSSSNEAPSIACESVDLKRPRNTPSRCLLGRHKLSTLERLQLFYATRSLLKRDRRGRLASMVHAKCSGAKIVSVLAAVSFNPSDAQHRCKRNKPCSWYTVNECSLSRCCLLIAI
jgi:hypothetical protein